MKNWLMYNLKLILAGALTWAVATTVVQAQNDQENAAREEEPVVDLDGLLEQVRQGIATQTQEFRQREAEFQAARDRQQQLLSQARQTRANEERRSERLEAQYNSNEQRITALTTQLRDKLGNLNEVFGVLQQVAGDTRSVFQQSLVSIEYPDRGQNLTALIDKVATGTDLPTIEEMEALWFEIQREMTQSGKISSFNAEIVRPDGTPGSQDLIRVGAFNVIGDGKYFIMNEDGALEELAKQPPGRFASTVEDLEDANAGEIVSFAIDPTQGQLLSVYLETPGLLERVDQGGIIGYLTLLMGAIGIGFVIWQGSFLLTTGQKVNRQMRSEAPSMDNPLGRVLQVYEDNKKVDVETLELKLDEAILKETPKLERFLTLIKLISAVAPLLGLLGTVTGMIATFQAITLFGTGDPKLMAGGISQALVTTVIGLVVAIPTLLLHSVVAGKSSRIVHVLEEQSAGKIAIHAEKGR